MSPASIRALDVLAYARELAPHIEYVNAQQGGDRDKDGLREADCVGFVNLILGHFDVRVGLCPAPTVPYTVPWYYSHWTGRRDPGTATPNRGDLLIIGDPSSNVTAIKFRHIGMATDAGRYISSLGVIRGDDAKEMAIPTAAHDRVVYILRCDFRQEFEMLTKFTPTRFGAALVMADPLIRLIRLRDGAYLKPGTTPYAALDGGMVTLDATHGGPDQQCYLVSVDGEPCALLVRNVESFTDSVATAEAAAAEAEADRAGYIAAIDAWIALRPTLTA